MMFDDLLECGVQGLMAYFGGMCRVLDWLMDRTHPVSVILVFSAIEVAALRVLPIWINVAFAALVWMPALLGVAVLAATAYSLTRRGGN